MTTGGLVLRQLRARPLRTALTGLAFGLSVGLLGFLFLLQEGLQRDWSQFQAQRAIVMSKTSFFERLPMSYLPKIEAIPGVLRVVPFDFLLSFYRDNRPENQIPVNAADPALLLEVYRDA